VRDLESLRALQEELEDRFGDPPRPVWNLMSIIELRLKALEVGVSSITHEKGIVTVKLIKRLSHDQIRGLFREFRRCRFLPDQILCYFNPKDGLKMIEDLLARLPKFEVPKLVRAK